MSGLVSSRLARRRIAARSPRGVSPSYIAGRTCGRPKPCSERAWSWASAFVGYRYSARALASVASTSSVGSWKQSDFPEAVPVVTIVGPSQADSIASAWWE